MGGRASLKGKRSAGGDFSSTPLICRLDTASRERRNSARDGKAASTRARRRREQPSLPWPSQVVCASASQTLERIVGRARRRYALVEWRRTVADSKRTRRARGRVQRISLHVLLSRHFPFFFGPPPRVEQPLPDATERKGSAESRQAVNMSSPTFRPTPSSAATLPPPPPSTSSCRTWPRLLCHVRHD